jgi:regulatory protein
MPLVTDLESARRGPGYLAVRVDGNPVGIISENDAMRLCLKRGIVVSEATVEEIQSLSECAEATQLAGRFLAHRPRTVLEVRQRLLRGGIGAPIAEAAIESLKQQGLLDDQRFADMWVENRQAFHPRSPRMLQAELRRKGVARETAEEAVEHEVTIDEAALAAEAGRPRLHRYRNHDRQSFDRSLGGFLARRGFSFDAVRKALEVLWQERSGEAT